MGAVAKAVPSAVPSAVTPGDSVAINQKAQRGPYVAPEGSSSVPYVPGNEDQAETPFQPTYATVGRVGKTLESGSLGAPSVPGMNGSQFTPGPIDGHYLVMNDTVSGPKVNNPPTRGMVTWVKSFANHVFNGRQNVDSAGWQQNSPQQRTSYMRITPPAQGDGYSPKWYVPNQLPQQPNTQKFLPVTGTDAPNVHVLNSSTYGAGQVAGGIGGNQYTPASAPPATVPVTPQTASDGMPMWG